MTLRSRIVVSTLSTATLAIGVLAATGSPPGVAAPDAAHASPAAAASARLEGDANGPLTRVSDGRGGYHFVGVPAGSTVRIPSVTSSTSVEDAAAAALDRYGPAFGAGAGNSLVQQSSEPLAGAGDLVRYQEKVQGLPVLGGQVIVSLRNDRQLSSILSRTIASAEVSAPAVGEDQAASSARQTLARDGGADGVKAASQGRWVVDPSLIGADASLPTRTAWRFDVSRGQGERRFVLVDDQTGAILMNTDEIEPISRVVCDNGNAPRVKGQEPPCTSGFARTETSGASGSSQVNDAFANAGETSTYYAQIAATDLTGLIGLDVGGGKAIAQTVRFCYTTQACPYANAFWNGTQMYYGDGYTGADDVVGHEMTHGVTERTSGLFYWGQSGAMNESMSDIAGEFIDHRNANDGAGTSDADWLLGEDLPPPLTGLRNMKDPTASKQGAQPDRTGSQYYLKEPCCSYPDEDGVHENSGVGNKTAYLIAAGGTFNGQTITSIDGSDAGLTKSAKLWYLTDVSLAQGSNWADEGLVLDQVCQALLGSGTSGFTAANCAEVHQATVATQLATPPAKNPQGPNFAATCPSGLIKQDLYTSESGDPTKNFLTQSNVWSRNGIPGFGTNARSNPSSWGGFDPIEAGSFPLVAARPVEVPKNQATYMSFNHWRLFDYDATHYFDAGTVEIQKLKTKKRHHHRKTTVKVYDGATLPWINGPSQPITAGTGNPAGARLGFGGDSRGYSTSLVDLSSFGGKSIRPQFTVNSDAANGYIGWYVDDIDVYTCSVPKVAAGKVKIKGHPVVGKRLKAKPVGWGPTGTVFKYTWLRNGHKIRHATAQKYKLRPADAGSRISVRVKGKFPGYKAATKNSKRVRVHGGHRRHHHRDPAQVTASSAANPLLRMLGLG